MKIVLYFRFFECICRFCYYYYSYLRPEISNSNSISSHSNLFSSIFSLTMRHPNFGSKKKKKYPTNSRRQRRTINKFSDTEHIHTSISLTVKNQLNFKFLILVDFTAQHTAHSTLVLCFCVFISLLLCFLFCCLFRSS